MYFETPSSLRAHDETVHWDEITSMKNNLVFIKLTEQLMRESVMAEVDGSCNETDEVVSPPSQLSQCDFCSYTSSSTGLLETHVIEQHQENLVEQIVNFGEFQLNCSICIFGANNTKEMGEHYQKKHSEKQQMFPCNTCGVLFGFQVALSEHVTRNHTTPPIDSLPVTLSPGYNSLNMEVETDQSVTSLISPSKELPPPELEPLLDGQIPPKNYLALILEQNLELIEQVNRLTKLVSKLEINQYDIFDTLSSVTKTNNDIIENHTNISDKITNINTTTRVLDNKVSSVSDFLVKLQSGYQALCNQSIQVKSKVNDLLVKTVDPSATSTPTPPPTGPETVQLSPPHFRVFSCTSCDKTYNAETSLWKHIVEEHKQQYPCLKCDFKAHIEYQIQKHMRVRHFEDHKLLYVGDTVSLNVNFKQMEREAQKAITTAKASISNTRDEPSEDHESFLAVVETELRKEKYKILVLAGGSVDITNISTEDNLDTTKLREEAVLCAQNLFCIAEAALEEYPELEKVVLVKNAPRFDPPSADPTQLRPLLSQLVDSCYFGLWCESKHKHRIVLGNHDLSLWSRHDHANIYGSPQLTRYDGVHMIGPSGFDVYTRSMMNIFRQASLIKTSPAPMEVKKSNRRPDYDPVLLVRQAIAKNRVDTATVTDSNGPPAPSSVPIPTGMAPPGQRPSSSLRASVIMNPSASTQERYSIPVSNAFNILGNW